MYAWNKPGCIFTPSNIVDKMVEKLFSERIPIPESKILDAGCGLGAFIDGIIRWCERKGYPLPQITGIEIEPEFVAICRDKYRKYPSIRIEQKDFLIDPIPSNYDYIISNPPYLSIEQLTEEQRKIYKQRFISATGRFDTYMLFFERALELLAPEGRLVIITPEKFMYVLSAAPLRKLLTNNYHVEEVELIEEKAFNHVIAYPAITTVDRKKADTPTRIVLRDGTHIYIKLPQDGVPWLPLALEAKFDLKVSSRLKLGDVTDRISCGVATGENKVFIIGKNRLPEALRKYAWPTISGKELSEFEPGTAIEPSLLQNVMLIPYDEEGNLLTGEKVQPLLEFLSRYRPLLEKRYCTDKRKKAWYAFHEDPPMRDLLKPKILCKDIGKEPEFWVDYTGKIIPQHSVYYIVPKDPEVLPSLLEYLNSYEVKLWLRSHCQRAANGFIRLQSHVLKRVPIKEIVIAYRTLQRWI